LIFFRINKRVTEKLREGREGRKGGEGEELGVRMF
jgi:hypothetical protein